MKKGDWVWTPRFLNVKIDEVYPNEERIREEGYTEPTGYWHDPVYGILGKSIEVNRMVFAAYRK